MSDKKQNVLFLCTGNSCRSQIAEGWLRHLAGDRFNALSAGTDAADEVNPLAVKVMDEIGIDISGQKPTDLVEYLGTQHIVWLIVVCNKAQQSCPRVWPGLDEQNRIYWPIDDPAEAEGTEDEKLSVFRQARDEIGDKIKAWLAE